MVGVWKAITDKSLVKTGSLLSSHHIGIKRAGLFFWAVPHAAGHKGAGATAQAS